MTEKRGRHSEWALAPKNPRKANCHSERSEESTSALYKMDSLVISLPQNDGKKKK
ncbi:MAG: hypothetical protein ACI4RJ_00880 [Alphaproteobacteria bacterium]